MFAIRPNSASNHTLLTPRYGQYLTHANNHITKAVSAMDSNLDSFPEAAILLISTRKGHYYYRITNPFRWKRVTKALVTRL